MTSNRRAVGIVLATILLIFATVGGTVSISFGGWWHVTWPLTAVFALIGAVGLTIELTRKKGDQS